VGEGEGEEAAGLDDVGFDGADGLVHDELDADGGGGGGYGGGRSSY